MKKLSKHQLVFAIISVVLTFTFLHLLNNFIANQEWKSINVIALFFGGLMFLNGLLNGYFDTDSMQRIDLSFRYHLITFITFNVMHIIYVVMANSNFTFKHALLSTLFWGIGIIVHYLYARKTIKGYTAEELFD